MRGTSRRYFRFPPIHWGEGTLVWNGDQASRVEIVDESLGGVGMVAPASARLCEGTIVRLANGDLEREARVVFRRPLSDEQDRVGAEWWPPSEYVEYWH